VQKGNTANQSLDANDLSKTIRTGRIYWNAIIRLSL
jgi:hypothetical protein